MYNKIFTKILDSSIWLEPDATRIVWLTCIAAMDEDGFCQFASVANLAHRANVSLESATRAVETLEQPDANSSDPEFEGRRIERVPGGWMVLNAEKYRDIVTRAVSRERTRARVSRYRSRQKQAPSYAHVTTTNDSVTQSEAVSGSRSDTRSRSAAEKTLPPRPRTFGRITLHRWQLEELINALGPHAADFGLDEWVDGLSAAADRDGLILSKGDTWPWVQEQLKVECVRRGLPVATVANGKAMSRSDQLTAMLARVAALDAKGGQ